MHHAENVDLLGLLGRWIWLGISMTVVMPPHTAAVEPVEKSSL
jgi:hypothetical protein